MGHTKSDLVSYNTRAWRRLRLAQLRVAPLCWFHLQQGLVVAGTVVDHHVPHRGNPELFNDPTNLRTLCATCHSSMKALVEDGRTVRVFGADGHPVIEVPGMRRTG